MHDLFAASHCKGLVDGIGGTIKRLMSHEVIRCQVKQLGDHIQ